MRVRITRPVGTHKMNVDPGKYAALAAYLLTPIAMTGYVMAFWRLGADMNWLGAFFVSKGLLSRWQVWLAMAAATQFAAQQLNRRGGRPKDPVAS